MALHTITFRKKYTRFSAEKFCVDFMQFEQGETDIL